jgi:cephalosporin-C deacetylase
LALAALDPRIRAVVAHLPFLCDYRKGANISPSLYKDLLKRDHATTAAEFRTLDYFDTANLVRHVKSPLLISAGGRDLTCPTETIRSAFDNAAGIKSFAYYPDLPHNTCGEFYEMSWVWLGKHLTDPGSGRDLNARSRIPARHSSG